MQHEIADRTLASAFECFCLWFRLASKTGSKVSLLNMKKQSIKLKIKLGVLKVKHYLVAKSCYGISASEDKKEYYLLRAFRKADGSIFQHSLIGTYPSLHLAIAELAKKGEVKEVE